MSLREKVPLKFATRHLKIDGEKAIEQFGARVQPDIVVADYDNEMVYIIEIKNLKCNKGKAIMKQAVYENFKQLRNYCLANKKMEVDGIASNFGVWHLTRYRKEDELLGRNAFQVTEEFQVMDNNEEHFDEKELRRLVFSL
jgi:hypothetical protein